MDVIRNGEDAPPGLRGGALAIGNFDGVHRGHQAVIGAALAWARQRGRPGIILTFDPHPSRLFRPDAPPFALTSLAQRLRLFAELGADAVMVLPFTSALAGLLPEEFVDRWLVGKLAPLHVVTGHDFTFGKGRSGDVGRLAELGRAAGFTTAALAPVLHEGEPVSSTRIRQALEAGDPRLAASLLTRPFAIEGEVIHGDKRGRTIGVPTANMELNDFVRPRFGVYAVRVVLPDGSIRKGVANLGIRPMFEPPRLLLETWILDWSGDLYGSSITVELIEWLRPELKLDGLDALMAQIRHDAGAARKVLG
jgi:riboflavin kinase/FMN adenylyltransferase